MLQYSQLTYIIEVSFEFRGAEDRQSVAQGVRFSKDLVVKWHLSCGSLKQVKAPKHWGKMMLLRRCQAAAYNKEVLSRGFFNSAKVR